MVLLVSLLASLSSFSSAVTAGAVAAHTAPVAWTPTPPSSYPDSLSDVPFASVSCVSATFCMAGRSLQGDEYQAQSFNGTKWSKPTTLTAGGYTSCPTKTFCASVSANGAATTWNGSKWSTAVTIDTHRPTAISCATPTFCMVVNQAGKADEWNGSTWTAPSVPNSEIMDSVSCPSKTFCVAVGPGGYAISWNGKKWSSDTVIAKTPSRTLTSVSCTSATFCATMTSQGDTLEWDGTNWSAPTPLVATDPLGIVYSRVSCAKPTKCVLIASFGTATLSNAGKTSIIQSYWVWNGTTWGTRHTMLANGIKLTGSTPSLSCPSSSFCLAVAVGVDGVFVSATWNGTNWSPTLDVGEYCFSTGSCRGTFGGGLYTSCPTSTFCASSDGYVVAFEHEGVWSPGTVIDGDGTIHGLSCPTTSFCVAIDTQGGAVVWKTGAWGTRTQISAEATRSLTTVSCASATFCAAFTQYGAESTWDGTSWSSLTQVDTSGQPREVSCPTKKFCMMVDANGYESVWNGTTWSAPSHFVTGTRATVASVSSASATYCLASTHNVGYLFTWTPSKGWSGLITGPGEGTVGGTIGIDAGGVTCVTSTFCYLYEQSYAVGDVSAVWNGTAYTQVTPTTATRTLTNTKKTTTRVTHGFWTVSCYGVNECVGGYGTYGNYQIAATSAGVEAKLSVKTTSLPAGTVGSHYTTTLMATGGTGSNAWTATGLPPGLTLNTGTGVITGSPTKAGTFTVQVSVTDGQFKSATATLVLKVAKGSVTVGASVSPTTTTSGATVTYSATVTAAVGTPTGTVSFTAGATHLCTGTVVSAKAGCKSTAAPTGKDTVTATYSGDSNFTGNSGTTTLTVNSAPHFTADTPPTKATVGKPYSYPFAASGYPVPTFSLATKPSWLSINMTTGVVSGTPPVATTSFSFKVLATNGITPAASAGPFTVTVYTLPATPTGITATAGVTSATVHWTEPATGGTATSFTVHSTPSVTPVTAPGTATSAKVSGLVAGTSYTFTVTAVNKGGTSTTSASSNAVVPTSVAPQGTKSSSGTNPSATTTKSPVTVKASSSGSGTLTVSTYPSDPVAAFSAGTTYFDVHTAPGGSFSAVTVTVCGLTTGQNLSWWNPAVHAWQKVSPQGVVTAGCITATLSGTSSPTVSQLVGTVFATTKAPSTTKRTTTPPPPPPAKTAGYDMVGSDGGVFVFSPPGTTGGFFGSLPGLGVKVNNVVGMVPTANDQGYFLVGSDGGVFAFGNAPFLGSLPGLGVKPTQPITGLVPTGTDGGYFLVGKDGGVFAFGNAQYLGSLPGIGVHRNDIIGIAATPSGNGYWLVAADGTVYGFGAAQTLGSATGTSSPVTAIAGTPDGGGYWIVTKNGAVHPFGDAQGFGTLPSLGVSPAQPVIGIVHTADTQGYWLIGGDGGIFAFGDAGFVGSLPGVGVHVTDVVGAVPTTG